MLVLQQLSKDNAEKYIGEIAAYSVTKNDTSLYYILQNENLLKMALERLQDLKSHFHKINKSLAIPSAKNLPFLVVINFLFESKPV